MSSEVDTILSGLRVLIASDEVVEMRAPVRPGRVISGYFNDLEKMAGVAHQLSGKHPGIYFTVNPNNPALLARRNNRVVDYAKETTSDADIMRRHWLPIDIDPARPSGIPSSDAEHEAAIQRAREIRVYLRSLKWPEPVAMDSGGGCYLLVPIDIPNDESSRDTLERCLKALSFRFDDDVVHVDTTMYNASRIIRVPGTLNAKGDSTEDRPHRLTRILHVPQGLRS